MVGALKGTEHTSFKLFLFASLIFSLSKARKKKKA